MNRKQWILLLSVLSIGVLVGVRHLLSDLIEPKWVEIFIIESVRFYPPLLAILATIILNIAVPKIFRNSYFKTITIALLLDLLISISIFIVFGGPLGREDNLYVFSSHFVILIIIPVLVRFVYNRLQ